MKKLLLGLSLFFVFNVSDAQNDKFVSAMKKNLSAIDSVSGHPSDLLALSNNFERIANSEKGQWLPYYYAALMEVKYAFSQADMSGVDPLADRASTLIQKADSISPKNSEVSCIKAMIATLRMLVNPQQRYMEQGAIITANLEAAKAQDPSNPRPYYLKGENLKNTPAQFGGGCGPASEALNIAKEKYASFKPSSDISPDWGLSRTEKLISECK